MIITISGSRRFEEPLVVEQIMAFLLLHPGTDLRVGDAKGGVDKFAWEVWDHGPGWTDRFEQERVQFYRAEWGRLHGHAGHIRNMWMLRGRDRKDSPDGGDRREERSSGLVVIFAPGKRSAGTSDALEQANSMGIPVLEYQQGWDMETLPRFFRLLWNT